MVILDGPRVLETLKAEAAACEELAAMRQEQRRLIDAGQAEKLLELLARKQQTLSKITQLEELLKPVKGDWERRRHEFAASQRIAISDAFRQVRDLLENLIARETEDAEALAARKTQAQQEIETFDRKRQLERAYRNAPAGSGGGLVDTKDA